MHQVFFQPPFPETNRNPYFSKIPTDFVDASLPAGEFRDFDSEGSIDSTLCVSVRGGESARSGNIEKRSFSIGEWSGRS